MYVHKQKALILIGTTTITYHFTMLLVFFSTCFWLCCNCFDLKPRRLLAANLVFARFVFALALAIGESA